MSTKCQKKPGNSGPDCLHHNSLHLGRGMLNNFWFSCVITNESICNYILFIMAPMCRRDVYAHGAVKSNDFLNSSSDILSCE